jgi:hypothetical protein
VLLAAFQSPACKTANASFLFPAAKTVICGE